MGRRPSAMRVAPADQFVDARVRARKDRPEYPLALTVKEAAAVVGVSVRTMYRAIEAGTIATVQLVPGGRCYIAREAIEDWLSSGQQAHP